MNVDMLVDVWLTHWLDADVYEVIRSAACYGLIPIGVYLDFAKLTERWRLVEENECVVDEAIGPYHVVAVADEDGFLQLVE